MLSLFKKTPKEESLSVKDVFAKLVKIKRGINLINEKLKSDLLKEEEREELESTLQKYWRLFENVQNGMFNVKKGLYMGMGFSMNGSVPSKNVQPIYLSWKSLHSHCGVQGTTRVGKSVLLMNMARQIIHNDENIIIVDPKGGFGQEITASVVENLAQTKRLKDFMYFSPAFPEISDRINVLFGLSNEEIASMISKQTETPNSEQFFSDVVYKTVMAITSTYEVLEMLKDPFGDKSTELLEKEIGKWKRFSTQRGVHSKIFDKKRGISEPDMIDKQFSEDGSYSESEAQQFAYNRTFITFKEIAKESTYMKLTSLMQKLKGADFEVDESKIPEHIKIKIAEKKSEAVMQLDDLLAQEKAFFTKISTSLSTILTQLSAGDMGKVFCEIRINPLFLHLRDTSRKLAVVIQPFPLKYKKISDMSIKIFMAMIESLLGNVGASGRAFNRRMNFLIDEAGSVAYTGMERILSQGGGLGASLFVYTQSFADWKLALGDTNSNVVMDNINTHVRMRMNDIESARIVSEEFGVQKKFKSSSMFMAGEAKFMTDIVDEWRVPPELLRVLPTAAALLKNEGEMYSVDLPYYSGPKGYLEMPLMKIEHIESKLAILNDARERALRGIASIKENVDD